jgi:hypothetical protein
MGGIECNEADCHNNMQLMCNNKVSQLFGQLVKMQTAEEMCWCCKHRLPLADQVFLPIHARTTRFL